MRKIKDLDACVAVLQAKQRRNDIEPQQKKDIEGAINAIKALRRLDHPSRPQMAHCVREIVDRIVKAFFK